MSLRADLYCRAGLSHGEQEMKLELKLCTKVNLVSLVLCPVWLLLWFQIPCAAIRDMPLGFCQGAGLQKVASQSRKGKNPTSKVERNNYGGNKKTFWMKNKRRSIYHLWSLLYDTFCMRNFALFPDLNQIPIWIITFCLISYSLSACYSSSFAALNYCCF